MFCNGFGIAAGTIHHLDVILSTILDVDVICPDGMADDAFSAPYPKSTSISCLEESSLIKTLLPFPGITHKVFLPQGRPRKNANFFL